MIHARVWRLRSTVWNISFLYYVVRQLYNATTRYLNEREGSRGIDIHKNTYSPYHQERWEAEKRIEEHQAFAERKAALKEASEKVST